MPALIALRQVPSTWLRPDQFRADAGRKSEFLHCDNLSTFSGTVNLHRTYGSAIAACRVRYIPAAVI
jgi:hypothetical protein